MTQKFFYIVEHFIPFPQSEYGGIRNVVAENDEECFDLITSADTSDLNEQWDGDLRENIITAIVVKLDEDSMVSGILDEFTT